MRGFTLLFIQGMQVICKKRPDRVTELNKIKFFIDPGHHLIH